MEQIIKLNLEFDYADFAQRKFLNFILKECKDMNYKYKIEWNE